MKINWLLVFTTVFLMMSQVFAADSLSTYKSAEFTIRYPSNFCVQQSRDRDGAYFTSPDKRVIFMVYSTTMITIGNYMWKQALLEETISSSTKNGRTYVFIKAIDGSYCRQYVEVNDGVSPFRVFGIRYVSADAYKKYKPLYEKFVGSFVGSEDTGDP
ncbi:MAG: hypothetical protein NTW79_02870 [Candidatus Berkelbacteria bacterium]|nr:hypothetical protein [Candidatus Berkelbacteria bacterium]